jgi:ribonuclease P protein component
MSRSFLVFAFGNGTQQTRFGITTPKKLGKAHERNRIKRRVREILRIGRDVVPVGLDFVINPKRSTMERPFIELRDELLSLLTRET